MDLLSQPGGHVFIADAPNWNNAPGKNHLTIGIWPPAISARAARGQSWLLGQLYGVVAPGLIFARHVFQGLKREMFVGDNTTAAKDKLALSWDAQRDAEAIGSAHDLKLRFCDAPPNRVFVVYVSPNRMLQEFPDLFGWAEHWTWVGADPSLSGAPVEWDTRYDRKVWSSAD